MRSASLHRARRRRSLGYTVMEVMMALAVLSVGATGVIAMQKTTLLGNVRARNLGTANSIAAAWVERLRTDATQWTDSGGLPNVGNTRWLNRVGTDFPAISGGEGVWFRPDPDTAYGVFPGADVFGLDTENELDTAFCTHLRLLQLTPNMIRAEVRVFWLRNQGGGTFGGRELCSADAGYVLDLSNNPEARRRYHFVYLATGILRNDSAR